MTAAAGLDIAQARVTGSSAEVALPKILQGTGKRLSKAVAALQTALAAAWRIDIVLARQRRWLDGWDFYEPENDRRETARRSWDLWHGAGSWYADSSFKAQWAQMTARFETIDAQALEPIYEWLGGTNHLRALRRLHADYGKALGITARAAAASDDPLIAPHLDALKSRLREWVAKVEATVVEEDPTSRTRADRLLEPIAAIETLTSAVPPTSASTIPEAPAEPG